jgi:peptide-methionine (S)-S-oxide reductase
MNPSVQSAQSVPRATTEVATLGGGCFWCLEAVFEQVRGVISVESGYSGGRTASPTYQQVCSGTTGHAEVVRITFDPAAIGYRDLLDIFFAIHDPTTPDRQGNDVGTQYRSAIYWHSPEQHAAALRALEDLERGGELPGPVVTELAAAGAFHKAEDYHQHYYARNAGQPYCRYVVAPKVEKFLRQFPGQAGR